MKRFLILILSFSTVTAADFSIRGLQNTTNEQGCDEVLSHPTRKTALQKIAYFARHGNPETLENKNVRAALARFYTTITTDTLIAAGMMAAMYVVVYYISSYGAQAITQKFV